MQSDPKEKAQAASVDPLAHIGGRRNSRLLHWWAYLLLAALTLSLTPAAGIAADQAQSKTLAGLTAYVGVVPAAIVRGHPGQHLDPGSHGGPPGDQHSYHILVALFDSATFARMEDARVKARVSALGLAGSERPLEPMRIAETTTYGNFFDLPGDGPYRIAIEVSRANQTIRFDFDYDHR